MACARIDDYEGPLLLIDLHAFGRDDAGQNIVHRAWQLATVHHEFGAEFEDVRSRLRGMFLISLAPLLHDVEVEYPTLPGIDPVRPCVQDGIRCP
jgi:hypothetical protein